MLKCALVSLTFDIAFTDGVFGRIPNFKPNQGSSADMAYMLAMRQNMVNYVHMIDIYAPCIVSTQVWNDETRMRNFCGDSLQLFHEHILSVSDEAFLLLVLINYTTTWLAEIRNERAEVSCCVRQMYGNDKL